MDSSHEEAVIRALIARYCDAVNRYDARAWADTWAEDGQWLFLQQGVRPVVDPVTALPQTVRSTHRPP